MQVSSWGQVVRRLPLVAGLLYIAACSGPSTSDTKIIGGRLADDHRFMAGIVFGADDDTGCGGTFVTPQLVVTAAHCIADVTSPIRVRPGSGAAGSAPLLDVLAIIPHPQYDAALSQNDVAVLYVEAGAEEAGVLPLSFNRDPAFPADSVLETVTVIGRGNTSSFGQLFEDELRQVDVPVVPTDVCASIYDPESITDGVICAGDTNRGGIDSCQGDSGGPLVATANGHLTLVGVVSWGEGCAQADGPGVYTRVSSVANWIAEQVALFSTPIRNINGQVLDAFVPRMCTTRLNTTQSLGTSDATASIKYGNVPDGPFALVTDAPSGKPAASCTMSLPGLAQPVITELRAGTTPTLDVHDATGQWRAPARATVKSVNIECEQAESLQAIFNADGYKVIIIDGEVYIANGEEPAGPVNPDTTATCNVEHLKTEFFIRQDAGNGSAAYWARFTGAEFGAADGKTLKMVRWSNPSAPGVSAEVALDPAPRPAPEPATVGTITFLNGSGDDIFTWRLTCDFDFALRDAAGTTFPTTAANGSWSLSFVAPKDVHGTFRDSTAVPFALTAPGGLPAAPRCSVNGITMPVNITPSTP